MLLCVEVLSALLKTHGPAYMPIYLERAAETTRRGFLDCFLETAAP